MPTEEFNKSAQAESRSRYLSLCSYTASKFGNRYGITPWTFFYVFATFGASYALHRSVSDGPGFDYSTACYIGLGLAMLAEFGMPPILRKNGVGLTKGGHILRSTQFTAVAASILVSAGMLMSAADNKSASTGPDTSDQQKTVHLPQLPKPSGGITFMPQSIGAW